MMLPFPYGLTYLDGRINELVDSQNRFVPGYGLWELEWRPDFSNLE